MGTQHRSIVSQSVEGPFAGCRGHFPELAGGRPPFHATVHYLLLGVYGMGLRRPEPGGHASFGLRGGREDFPVGTAPGRQLQAGGRVSGNLRSPAEKHEIFHTTTGAKQLTRAVAAAVESEHAVRRRVVSRHLAPFFEEELDECNCRRFTDLLSAPFER